MSQVYAFKARTSMGQAKIGNITAESQSQALSELQEQGLIVTDLQLSRDIAGKVQTRGGLKGFFGAKVPLKDLAVMSRQFAVLYSSGVTIVQSLDTVARQTTNPRLKDALRKVYREVEGGAGVGEAMKRNPELFPVILYNMVAAGEVAGSLDVVLDRAASHFEREHEVESKIKAALFYPKLVVGVIVLVGAFLITLVVPRFAELFTGMGVTLHLPTRMLIFLGVFVSRWWWTVALAGLGAWLSLTWYGNTPRGKVVFDRLSLRLPIFGELNKKNIVSRFCRNLATLSRSGVPIIPAIMLVRQTIGNSIVAEALSSAQEAIRAGHGIAPQLEKSGYFPPLVVQMVYVGEETGMLDSMLERASDFYDAEIKATTEQMTQLIEPMVFIFLGIVVAFIILAIVLPMFDSLQMVG